MVKNNERGVSETIGFVLILGIVITGIGIVTLYGYPILLQQQENANIKNMEKNLIVLQNDVKLLAYKSVPYRETTMQVSGGTLSVIKPNPTGSPGDSYFTIQRSGAGGVLIPFDGAGGTEDKFYPGLLQFQSDSYSAIIGLQNGAVVTNGFSQTFGSTMLSEPRWFLDDDPALPPRTLVINMIQVTSADEMSTNGIGTVQMSVSQLYPTQDILLSPSEDISITYYGGGDGYTTAWQNYFKNPQVFTTTPVPIIHPNPCSVSGSTLTIPDVTRIVIKSYKIDVLNL
jgi:hypothetical protein